MRRLVLATVAATLLAAPAGGTSLAPYTMTISLGDDTFELAELESAGLVAFVSSEFGGDYSTTGPITQAGDWRLDSWTSSYSNDPAQVFVTSQLEVTNLSTETRIFSVMIQAPAELSTLNDFAGSVFITLTSDELPGATFSTAPGTPLYTALVDGATVRTLRNDPYSRGCAGSGCSIKKGVTFWKDAGIGDLLPTASIGISLEFVLSPGDSALINGAFDLDAIPEPTTFLLLGGGLAAIGFSRRRRSHRPLAGAARALRSRRRSARRKKRPT
jgi:hypothetical protein